MVLSPTGMRLAAESGAEPLEPGADLLQRRSERPASAAAPSAL